MVIRPIDKENILHIAKKTLKTSLEILAYGSRVNHKAHACSDLDLAIRTQTRKPLNINELTGFRQALQDSNIPFIVQVFDWEQLPDTFRRNILLCHKVIFSNIDNTEEK